MTVCVFCGLMLSTGWPEPCVYVVIWHMATLLKDAFGFPLHENHTQMVQAIYPCKCLAYERKGSHTCIWRSQLRLDFSVVVPVQISCSGTTSSRKCCFPAAFLLSLKQHRKRMRRWRRSLSNEREVSDQSRWEDCHDEAKTTYKG
jgi:hypothetical protein